MGFGDSFVKNKETVVDNLRRRWRNSRENLRKKTRNCNKTVTSAIRVAEKKTNVRGEDFETDATGVEVIFIITVVLIISGRVMLKVRS